jgi:hypothetical protein
VPSAQEVNGNTGLHPFGGNNHSRMYDDHAEAGLLMVALHCGWLRLIQQLKSAADARRSLTQGLMRALGHRRARWPIVLAP